MPITPTVKGEGCNYGHGTRFAFKFACSLLGLGALLLTWTMAGLRTDVKETLTSFDVRLKISDERLSASREELAGMHQTLKALAEGQDRIERKVDRINGVR